MNSREVLRSGLPPASSYHAALEEALVTARSSAPSPSDPPWYAQAGYVAAAGSGGSAHLAWERVRARLTRVQAEQRGNEFDDLSIAFAMGFGIGLVDVGCVTLADGEELYRALLSDPHAARPTGNGRSLLWVGVVLLVLVSAAAAFGVHRLRPLLASNSSESADAMASPEGLLAPGKLPATAAPMVAVAAPTADAEAASGWKGDAPEPLSTRPARRDGGRFMHVDHPARAAQVLADLPFSQGQRKEELRRRMNGLSAADRLEVLRAAAESDEKLLPVCIDYCLKTADPEVVLAATDLVIQLPAKEATRQLVALLRHRMEEVQVRAGAALKRIAAAETLWPYVSLVKDRDAAVSGRIREALAVVVGKDHGDNLKAWWAALKAVTKANAKQNRRRR